MKSTDPIYQHKYDHTILVLQGGGALGAYQAGVFEGLVEAGFSPNWVTGVSIGAINAALITGNPAAQRLERLRTFWDMVSSNATASASPFLDPFHKSFNQVSAATSAMLGVPGFFMPRVPPCAFAPQGSDAALSVYDTSPLKRSLEALVDFDIINRGAVRLSVGATNIRTGNSTYFDNQRTRIGVEHIMASGALPPAFPPVLIDGERYWDGGIVSNSPLWYVLDEPSQKNVLIVQVDLFNAKGEDPRDLDEVMGRHQDIVYSSKTRFNTKYVRDMQQLQGALHRLLKKLPEELKSDADVKLLGAMSTSAHIDIVHLINRRYHYTSYTKDYEFSRVTIRQLWEAGLQDVRHSVAHPEWLSGATRANGIRVYDLTRPAGSITE